jgi:hypothetical protein
MSPEESSPKDVAENFSKMIETFGDAISQIFKDPELKEKAKEFGDSTAKSVKTFSGRFQDEDVKGKFKDVGKAAQDFGKSVADYFREDKT